MTIDKKKYPYISFVLSVAVTAMVFAVLGIFPFGDKTVVTGDFNSQYMSYFAHFADSVQQSDFKGLFYGFDKSLGGSLIGTFAYHAVSPVNLLYLFFTPDKYPLVATVIFAVKIALSSATMCYLLIKRFDNIDFVSVPLSMCYGFCAYSLVYFQHTMWQDSVLLLPLVIYGIYIQLKENRPLFYILSLSMAAVTNFYTGYMVCLFSVIFFLYELFTNYKVKQWFNKSISFGISSLCAGGLSACLLIPMYLDVRTNKGISDRLEVTGATGFKLNEFFYRLLPFNFDWSNLENGLPNVYTGTLCIVFVVLFLVGKKISAK